ncbi:hypothetical protein ACT3TC_13225 [Halomonas sp. AOP27-A1-41]|uniref:hypothetical protein n=1 Tax=Halomonas sp. AOP27-A1-41 TaxID=3457707 RepID=UPI004033C1A6
MTTDKVRSVVHQAGYEAQALNEEASRLEFPEGVDIAKFIQQQIDKAYELIPDIQERNPGAIKFLRVALNAYSEGDMEDAKRWLHRGLVSIRNNLRELWEEGVSKQFGRNVEEARRKIQEERQPEWDVWQRKADEIVTAKRATNPKKDPSAREVARIIAESPEGGGKSFEAIRKHINIRG